MEIFNIKTTLAVQPTVEVTPKITYLIRGSTATLTFDCSDKPYSIENLEQVTFIFQQEQAVHAFNLFVPLQPTEDVTVIPGKDYYTDVQYLGQSQTVQYSASLVEQPSGNPSEQGYFEEAPQQLNLQEAANCLNPRFEIDSSDSLTLFLSSKDTLKFTSRRSGWLEFEVAVVVDTTQLPGFGGKSSVIIEPQDTLKVVDSLYSKL